MQLGETNATGTSKKMIVPGSSPRAKLCRQVARESAAVRRAASVLILTALTGCATPPAVKQAVTSIDQGYADNLEMMNQYRALVVQTNERYGLWLRYVRSRALLNSAVKWATTDPVANDSPDRAKAKVGIESDFLGPDLIKEVNKIRMKGLPARAGPEGTVFEASQHGTMTTVVEALPALVNAVNRKVDADAAAMPKNDLSGFDAYATNVSALRQINSTIKTYLDIDVTVKPEDLNEITQAIRALR